LQRGRALLVGADGEIGAAVEPIDRIRRRSGCAREILAIDDGGEQFALAPICQRVQQRERSGIVAIARHVGVQDQPHGRGGERTGQSQNQGCQTRK